MNGFHPSGPTVFSGPAEFLGRTCTVRKCAGAHAKPRLSSRVGRSESTPQRAEIARVARPTVRTRVEPYETAHEVGRPKSSKTLRRNGALKPCRHSFDSARVGCCDR
jgi:hypothetical protein